MARSMSNLTNAYDTANNARKCHHSCQPNGFQVKETEFSSDEISTVETSTVLAIIDSGMCAQTKKNAAAKSHSSRFRRAIAALFSSTRSCVAGSACRSFPQRWKRVCRPARVGHRLPLGQTAPYQNDLQTLCCGGRELLIEVVDVLAEFLPRDAAEVLVWDKHAVDHFVVAFRIPVVMR